MHQPEPSAGQAGFTGRSASQMTGRNAGFENLGDMVMGALKKGGKTGGYIKTGIVFDSEEEAFSFGRYYYRYIYLGKEEVTLYSFDENGKYAIFVSCGDPDKAVSEHGQVQDRLSQVVQACRTLSDREKAEYFYDWVYDNVSYDQTLNNRTVYDAVMNGSAVCWGYVSAYLMLCRNAGLICEPVYAGNHAWNRTWIDGEWRYCDITWDKSLGGTTWKFLTQKDMDSDSMHNNL
ncbi:transglutaminase domain-containing protein [Enterocloster aldenensis]|uniref:transglutaminase domain-containing protein n=1 Tax=Enterocloster aldenensis TaxID=358742 RepID=UPI001F256B03